MKFLAVSALAMAALAPVAHAASFTPGDAPVVVSPAFGPVAEVVGTS